MKKSLFFLIVFYVLATAVVVQAETIANITARQGLSLTIDKGSSSGVQVGMRGKIQVTGKDAVGQYEMAIGDFVVKKVFTESAEIYAERVDNGKNLADASFVVFALTLKAPTASIAANPTEVAGSNSSANVDREVAQIKEVIAALQSSALKKQANNGQAAIADYDKAINIYDGLGEAVKAAIEKSDTKIIGTLYSQRGYSKYLLSETTGALSDWSLAAKLGCRDDQIISEAKKRFYLAQSEIIAAQNKRMEEVRARRADEQAIEDAEEEEQSARRLENQKKLFEGMQKLNNNINRSTQENLEGILRKQEEDKQRRLEQERLGRLATEEAIKKQREEQERQRQEQEKLKKQQEEEERAKQDRSQPAQKQGATGNQDQKKQQTVLPVEILTFDSDIPQGTREPCGDYKGSQYWEQRVRYTFVNPNDYAAEVKFFITIDGKSFNNTKTVNAHQTYSSFQIFNIGCNMYNPGKKETEIKIIEFKLLK